MKKAYHAKLNMAQTCQAILHAPEHAATHATGSKSWQDAVNDLDRLVQAIMDASQVLDGSKGISSAGKIAAREQLGDCAYAIASSLHALAPVQGLPDLAAGTDFPRSLLSRGTSLSIYFRCAEIHRQAAENLTMLQEDNVTAEDLEELHRCLENFERLLTRPRDTRVAGKAARMYLDELFEELTNLFKHRLDRLVVKFQRTAPELHAAYVAARKIGRPATAKAHATEPARDCGAAQPQPRKTDPSPSPDESRPSEAGEPVVAQTGCLRTDSVREFLTASSFGRCCGRSATPPRSELSQAGTLIAYSEEHEHTTRSGPAGNPLRARGGLPAGARAIHHQQFRHHHPHLRPARG